VKTQPATAAHPAPHALPAAGDAGDRPSRAGSLALVGGALCLDFANTTSGRGTPMRLEHLRSWDHLLAWSEHVGIIDAARRMTFTELESMPTDAALKGALGLREAIHEMFGAAITRSPPSPAALDRLNEVLSQSGAAARLASDGRGYAWSWPDLAAAPQSLLWPVARSAAALLTGGDLARVKFCPGMGCGWLFLDRTRNGRRRWCEMEVCGSRAKMRRYHQRRRSAAPHHPA
jgi:predicted RNA-binding Zn ribbon-like protein